MIRLPVGVPSSSGWVEDDRISVRRRAVASAGAVTMEFEQLADSEKWLIEHAVIQCPSLTPTQLRLYESSVSPDRLLDGSAGGNFDVADWSPGLLLGAGQLLIARWDNASSGAVATLYLQVRVYRKVIG